VRCAWMAGWPPRCKPIGLLRRVRGIRSEIWRALRATSMPARVRCDLIALAFAKRVARPAEWTVHLPSGNVYLSERSFREDTEVLYEVLANENYKTRYEGAVVVDVGAHRGYYGAYALWRGARTVFSYEPEAHNYASLIRADLLRRRPGQEWRTYQAAVSSAGGRATLYVTKASWTHSLFDYKGATETQDVSVVAMADVLTLARAAARAAAAPLIVKVDAEGAECSIILDTPPSSWEEVAELFIDTHPPAPCSRSAMVAHLDRAGLSHCETRAAYYETATLVFRQRGRPPV
jgi:FkbM family methyltransferase